MASVKRRTAVGVLLIAVALAVWLSQPNSTDVYGTWEVVSSTVPGLGFSSDRAGMGMRLSIEPDEAYWHFDTPEGRQSFKGTCRVNSATSPKQIDLGQPGYPDPANVALGIYKFEGDILVIHMGETRPESFAKPASQVAFSTLELAPVR